MMLRGGGDIPGGWLGVPGWAEEFAAEVLQLPQRFGGHGEPAPACRGPVEHGPDQGQAGLLAGEPADDLDAAAGLAEGAIGFEVFRWIQCSAGNSKNASSWSW